MEDSESRAALWQRKRPATPATMLTHIKALTLESQHDYCQLLPDDPPQLTRQVWRWISIHQLLTRRAAKSGQLWPLLEVLVGAGLIELRGVDHKTTRGELALTGQGENRSARYGGR